MAILSSKLAKCYPIQFLGPALNGIFSKPSNLSVSWFNLLSEWKLFSSVKPLPILVNPKPVAITVPFLIDISPILTSDTAIYCEAKKTGVIIRRVSWIQASSVTNF